MYFWLNKFKLNQTFILMGWREYLYICVYLWYEASLTQIKW